MKKKIIFLILYFSFSLLNSLDCKAQVDSIPKGIFLQDSVSIGLPIFYAFSYQHTPDRQLVFPDSLYNYAPFDFVKKIYFETKTQNNLSLDSVVYELVTFDITPTQKLSLPVFIEDNKGNLIPIFSKSDSIYLKELVKGDLMNQNLKEQTTFQNIEAYFNYPYLIAAILIFFIITLIIWFLLGNRLRKIYRLFQFRTRHAIFLNDFTRLTNRITSRQSIEDIEKAISLWKKHLEYVENKPFSSYTSKEIIQAVPDDNLADSLKSIDKAIYGKEISEEIDKALTILRNISIFISEKRKEEMRNA